MSFLNPWFLIGALSLAIPVIVHLVRRERARRTPFPSLLFLRQIPQKSVRRRRLRHLLLLALRCLALLLLVLAFARPFIPQAAETDARERGRNLVILLDTSYSMQYGDRFDRARREARSVIASAHPKDRIAVMTFSQGYELRRPLSEHHELVLSDLDEIRPTIRATDYGQALRGAESVLADAEEGENVIVLISDFQASGWDRARDPFPLNGRLIPIDVARDESTNLACTDIGLSPVVYAPKYEETLLAKITNFSDRRQSTRVRLWLNGHLVSERRLELEARAGRAVEFGGFALLEGSNRGIVEIDDDALSVDNRFFFVIEKVDPLAVLDLESTRGESFYLEQALAVSRNNPYALTVKPVGRASAVDLERANTVILNDVSQMSRTMISRLTRWVKRGGGLLIALGRRVTAKTFNRAFANLAPAHLEERVGPTRTFELLAQFDTRHPIFAPFSGPRSGNFSQVRFYGHIRATAKETATVLARLTSGDPLLLERSLGRGRVILFTSSLDTSWNDLPLSPMYVPLVHQLLRRLHPMDVRGWYSLGEAIRIPGATPQTPVPVDTPSERRLRPGDGLSPDGTVFTAREQGFYRLRTGDGERYIAVNVDVRESNLQKLNVEELVTAFGGSSGGPRERREATSSLSLAEERPKGRTLGWPLLVAAIILFIVEGVWAKWLRDRASASEASIPEANPHSAISSRIT